MQFRAVKRAFFINRAVKKYNKSSGLHLVVSDIYTLFIINELGEDLSISRIVKKVNKLGRATKYEFISMVVSRLVSFGLVSKVKGKIYDRDYLNITLAGVNVLAGVEKILRVERTDR